MRSLLIGALLFSAAACTEPRSETCKAVCERETQCADDNQRFDLDECVTACSALIRDTEGKKQVDQHVACVDKADTCAEVNGCSYDKTEAPDKPK